MNNILLYIMLFKDSFISNIVLSFNYEFIANSMLLLKKEYTPIILVSLLAFFFASLINYYFGYISSKLIEKFAKIETKKLSEEKFWPILLIISIYTIGNIAIVLCGLFRLNLKFVIIISIIAKFFEYAYYVAIYT